MPYGTVLIMNVDISQLQLSDLRNDKRVPTVPLTFIERIERFGQVDPVIVRTVSNGRYEILSHAETWLAVQRLGQFQIDVLVRDDLNDSDAADLVNMPPVLDPITEAELFQERIGFIRRRGDITRIAQQYKVSRSHVAHALRLLELPESIQGAVRAGALRRGHAKALLTLESNSERQRFAASIVSEKWSVGKTEKTIREHLQQRSINLVTAEKSPETKRLERQLTEAIGSGVTIDETGGTLTINYQRNLDVLDGIICRIAGRELVDFG